MKAKQIGFQILRRIYKPRYPDLACPLRTSSKIHWTYLGNQGSGLIDDVGLSFRYLNQNVVFNQEIDWNYSTNGKLWAYNLNYFDYLSNPGISDDLKMVTMRDFLLKRHAIKDGMEPYPISLRNMNWIKFCYSSGVREFDNFIYSQASLLSKSFEYHLMGNHLLENAFSLLFAAYYFEDITFYNLASNVLRDQLEEQILSDGAHFERSPMYHQIILYRMLDAIHLIKQNVWENDLLQYFEKVAAAMLSWILQVSFTNGRMPMVNDSSPGISPSTEDLSRYAAQMDILPSISPLGESGYRMKKMDVYECLVDCGDIGPDYIPGHAHSDTFSFELYIKGQPLIVDTGVSTYENNQTRWFERSTAAHNTVQVAALDQSEVWGAFRVARRAKIIQLEERADYLSASHDGYLGRLGIEHKREFKFEPNQIIIRDTLSGSHNVLGKAYFHFPSNINPVLIGDKCELYSANIFITNGKAQLDSYNKAEGFNKRVNSQVLVVEFYEYLEIKIEI